MKNNKKKIPVVEIQCGHHREEKRGFRDSLKIAGREMQMQWECPYNGTDYIDFAWSILILLTGFGAAAELFQLLP